MIYVDSSALVKLIHLEQESVELDQWLGARLDDRRVSSALVEVEVPRALPRRSPSRFAEVSVVLADVDLVDICARIRARAAGFRDPMLRSLDAIHLATALEIRDEVVALVSYDRQMLEAAAALGLSTVSPGLK